jgi:hypothetical protein
MKFWPDRDSEEVGLGVAPGRKRKVNEAEETEELEPV